MDLWFRRKKWEREQPILKHVYFQDRLKAHVHPNSILRAERKWRTTRSVADLVSFKRHKNHVTHLLKEAKSAFLTDFISQNSDNQGKLFRAVKNRRVETKSLCFSDYTDKSALENNIGKYFVQKISRLHKELDQGYWSPVVNHLSRWSPT